MTAKPPSPEDPPRTLQARAGAGSRVPPASMGERPIASEALFAGAKEVQILHRGSLYRLKQTALGKLILTK